MSNSTLETTSTLTVTTDEVHSQQFLGCTKFLSSLFASLLVGPERGGSIVRTLYQAKSFKLYKESDSEPLMDVPVSNAQTIELNDSFAVEFIARFYGTDTPLPEPNGRDRFRLALCIGDNEILSSELSEDVYASIQSQLERIAIRWTVELTTQSEVERT